LLLNGLQHDNWSRLLRSKLPPQQDDDRKGVDFSSFLFMLLCAIVCMYQQRLKVLY